MYGLCSNNFCIFLYQHEFVIEFAAGKWHSHSFNLYCHTWNKNTKFWWISFSLEIITISALIDNVNLGHIIRHNIFYCNKKNISILPNFRVCAWRNNPMKCFKIYHSVGTFHSTQILKFWDDWNIYILATHISCILHRLFK